MWSTLRAMHRKGHTGRLVIIVVTIAAGVSACSRSHGSGKSAASTATTLAGPAPAPRSTAEAALDALLKDEERGDHAASFLLLSPASRQEFKSVADWTRRRNELPQITSFTVDKGLKSDSVVATVEHKPALDPFLGLSPARERQAWHPAKVKGGFLLDAEPDTTPILPPEDAAGPAATAWMQAVQACDQPKALSLQAVPTLYGQLDAATGLCHSAGAVTAGPIGTLAPGPASSDIVAQYGTDALEWARTVAVTAPTGAFHVVMAPIGDRWLVLGVAS